MRNLHKLLIVLISVAFIGTGVMAQTDASPQLKDQMERVKVKPNTSAANAKVMGATESAPNDYELMVQSQLGYISNPDHSNSSVLNNMLFEYKIEGNQSAITELTQNATNPPNYKPITLNIDGTTAYAFVAYDPGAINPIGPATFDVADPGTISSLGANTAADFICGGSWADDVWYGVEYGTGTLYTMDVSSGAMTMVGTSGVGFNAMAYDPSTSTMYAATGDVLYTVDLSTGAATMVGTIQTAGDLIIGLACSAGGELYGTCIISDVLYSIDPVTGAGTVVGSLGIDISYAQSLEYDNENDILYAGAYTTQGELYTIDPTTAAATFVGAFQGGAEMCALAFPYSAVSYDDDLGIQSIVDPSTGVDLTAAEAVTVMIKNYGTNAQSNFDVWFTLDGGTAVNETISATLNAGESMEHTFATTVDLSAYGSYEFEACVVLSGDENDGNDCKQKTVENLAPSLCYPTYSSGCVVGDGITDFAVEQISNLANGCEDNIATGVSDYTNLGPAILFPGGTHTFTLGTGYSTQHTNIWIDFNDNLLLEADELILYNYIIANANQLYDVDITLPPDAEEGLHYMRVMAVWITEFTDPCGSYSYGESEDYMVNVGVAEYGILNGTVTANAGGAIEGAMISVANGNYTTTTASDGTYEIVDILTGDWDISCMATGYNPAFGTISITNGGTTTEDFAMLAPTMDIDPMSIDITIDPNTMAVENIDISNNGDGVLDWDASLELLTDNGGTDDAWDLIWEMPVGVGGGEAGLETDGIHIYTTKWNGTGEYYRYDMDGNYIEEITVAGAAGTRDMAYDGTYFYGGAASPTIFQLDLANATLVSTFTAPANSRAIAYNEDEDVFYCNNWSDNITAFDMTGANLGSWPVGASAASYYGFAYDNYSNPGTPYLWGASQTGATGNELIQMTLPDGAETGFTFDAGSLLSTFDICGGLAIDNNIELGKWAFLGTCQNVNLWTVELADDTGGGPWITINPNSGTVEAGNMETMNVNFDATDIVPGTVKTANIHFTSDPDVGTVIVPVSMTVGDQEFGYIEGNVELTGSSPYNYEDVENVLVEAGPYMAYPDANGDYQITVYPGTYDVTATLYGYEMQTTTDIAVAAGATVAGIDFTMPTLIGYLMGYVTDVETGDPIENVTITILETDFVLMTDVDGFYELFLEAGTYDIEASHPTYITVVAADVEIMVEADTEQDFELEYSCDYCDATTGVQDEYITDVICGDIQNLGTPWQGGIADYTDQSTIILPGFSEDITVNNGNAWASDIVYVWVDWNANCEFDVPDEEFQLENVGGTGATFTGAITVPVSAVEGVYRMRVRMTYSTAPVPCGEATYGEIEEYSIFVPPGTYGELEGYVTEIGSGDPIEGAEIDVAGLYMTTSGSDGYYYFEEIFTGTWDVYCTATGYTPDDATVTITEGNLTEQDFELGVPGFSVDPLAVDVTLEPNAMADEVVTISNPGNSAIDWSASLMIITDDNGGTDDPWDLIWEVPVGVGGGEAGIETNGTYIYTTKWNGTGEYYRYSMDGTYIETITVGGAAGTRDMAFDGTYFYGGAASTTIFELDLDNGALISTFTGPAASRAIAYNEDEDVFYCNNWSDNITVFDKTGANLGGWPVGASAPSYYGFAYDGYSDGAPYLWGASQTGATGNELIQMSLPDGAETGFTFDAGSLLSAFDITGGLAIDNNIQAGTWAFLGTCQNVNLWTIELAPAGPVWLSIDPTSGTLAAGATSDMDLHFDATDLLPGIYEAEIHFSTDPNVGEPIVQVTLTVEGLIPAINLAAMYECTDVMLTWEMPTGGNPDSWKIYRDGEEIDDVTSMEYTDMMVDPEVEYTYTVTAVYAGDESQPSSPAMITVPTPDDLEALDIEAMADTPNENDVTLTWAEPAACVAPDSYSIYRDNTMIADGVTGLEYEDLGLSAGFYEYYVVAVYYFGESAASDPAYVLITGVEDYDASLFQIYPNPATELVNVKSPVSIDRIYVLNNSGQLVVDEEVNNTQYQINVSRYEAGIYFIKLETSEGVILRKVAVK